MEEPKQTIHAKFKGIDEWNRACFKVLEGGYYIGSTDKLFNYDENPETIKEYFKNHTNELCYFGKSFGCEPMGNPMKSNVEIIII